MFGLFKSKQAKLESKYQQLLAEAHRLSHINRKESDLKTAEAEVIRKELELLEKAK